MPRPVRIVQCSGRTRHVLLEHRRQQAVLPAWAIVQTLVAVSLPAVPEGAPAWPEGLRDDMMVEGLSAIQRAMQLLRLSQSGRPSSTEPVRLFQTLG